MVKIQLEDEVQQIFELIKNEENFLLTGGAGSGKTYSLVHVIKKVLKDNPNTKVACITYTNTAVNEIEGRVNHNNLRVSTIHDFLWDNIKTFQKELKNGLINLINDDNSPILGTDNSIDPTFFNEIENGIQYKEYNKIKDGIISHEEVLELANYMFKNYSLLCDILKDRYNFIFIDEYQDTSPLVVEIFLGHLKKGKKKNTIGFFGDSMQSIYEDGIGDLNNYVESLEVKEVQKKQNRRNPKLVIDLANRLRTDNLIQEPSTDNDAPNMHNGTVKMGNIKFLYSSINDLDIIKKSCYFSKWDITDTKQTKELNLTHNLIAAKAGFSKLMEIYDKDPLITFKNEILKKIKNDSEENKEKILNDENITFEQVIDLYPLLNKKKQLKKDIIIKDPVTNKLYEKLKDLPFSVVKKIYLNKDSLIDDKKQENEDESKKGSKRDDLIKHLFRIQSLIQLYKEKKYNMFIRKTEYTITSIEKKKAIKEIVERIESMSEESIEAVINFADEKQLCKKDDKFYGFISNNNYLYNRVKKLKFREFQNLFNYLEGYTPFSTQHKIKGEEFNNVLVILDNGKWNNYNFEYLFCSRTDKIKVLKRTQKIFYVCCTRAKENLFVFYHNPTDAVLDKAKEWFGDSNVHRVAE